MYASDEKWKLISDHILRSSSGATVIDVCFNIAQNALYFCEEKDSEGKPTCAVYKRQVVESMHGRVNLLFEI